MSAKRSKGFGKKAMATCMALALSVMLIPSAALAADDYSQSIVASGDTDVLGESYGDLNGGTGGGLQVIAKDGQKAEVQAGNVTAHSTGVNVQAGEAVSEGSSEGTASVTTGDVQSNGIGVDVRALKDSSATITVKGDIASTNHGAEIRTSDNGTVKLTVEGDVTSKSESGLYLGGNNIEVSVSGTISGGQYGIELSDGNVVVKEVTVWKIVGKDENSLIGGAGVAAEDVERFAKSINYIIKVSEKDSADKQHETDDQLIVLTTAAADDDLTATSQRLRATNANGETISSAKEGERVYLAVPEGYEIVQAYSSGILLTADANGNYSIIVPRGGGVDLTAVVQLIDASKKAADNTSGNGNGSDRESTGTRGTNADKANADSKDDAKDTSATIVPKTGDSIPVTTLLAMTTLLLSIVMLAISGTKLQVARATRAGKHIR
ncbi:MAG: hypothetical protein IJ111_10155 [Eggerthellaceae bacterium]|nr:hypothetical protein [Eggerthellaceae bacterium]